MAQAKAAALLATILLLPVLGAGLSFNVNIGSITDHDFSFLKYRDSVDAVQSVNATLENSGSIGCTFYVKGTFDRGNETIERYSEPYPLFPGNLEVVELHYVPINYTGPVNASIAVEYCGQAHNVSTFTFNVSERLLVNETMNTTTTSVETDEAVVETPFQSGLLVPKEAPSYWKVSAAEIEDGKATIRYDAPIFSNSTTLEYVVVNRSADTVEAAVTVDLTDERSWFQRFIDSPLYMALAGSGLLNIILLTGIVVWWRRSMKDG